LSADYDERPRQKADRNQGKYASTLYTVLGKNTDGTVDIAFYPVTGRTHQLRVHSAHHLGLGSPILGDMLYGGQCSALQDADEPAPKRLHLHARSISFTHPTSGKEKTVSTMAHCFNDLTRQSSL
jgi:tRNA pseudouridine32 synthase/23S rRNA pseudouridine746 synthase